MRIVLIWLVLTMPCWAAASRSFDNVNDNVNIGNVLDVTTGDVSLACWNRPNDDAEADGIFGKKGDNSATTAGYAIRQNTTDASATTISDATDQANDGSGVAMDDNWYFAAGTWTASTETSENITNGSTNGGTAVLNVDSLSSTSNLMVGGYSGGGNDYNGEIAYCSVFLNVVFTEQQREEVRWFPDRPGINSDGFWPLWGDSPEIDLSANANTGTMEGTTTSTDGPPVMFGEMIL